MPKYLNGRAEEAIRKATSTVLGVPEAEVTPEFYAQQERDVARRRRWSASQLRAEFQAWQQREKAKAKTKRSAALTPG